MAVGSQSLFDDKGRVIPWMLKDIQEIIFPFLIILHEVMPGVQDKSHSNSLQLSVTYRFV